jgi:hypothetical protein
MTALNYTPLRHKMLAAIADGKVRTKPGQGWRFEVAHAGQAHMARTCGDLWDAQLLDLQSISPVMGLNPDGQYVLEVWTAQHGEPTP